MYPDILLTMFPVAQIPSDLEAVKGLMILDQTLRTCERVYRQREHHEGFRWSAELAPKPVPTGRSETKLGIIAWVPKHDYDCFAAGAASRKSRVDYLPADSLTLICRRHGHRAQCCHGLFGVAPRDLRTRKHHVPYNDTGEFGNHAH